MNTINEENNRASQQTGSARLCTNYCCATDRDRRRQKLQLLSRQASRRTIPVTRRVNNSYKQTSYVSTNLCSIRRLYTRLFSHSYFITTVAYPIRNSDRQMIDFSRVQVVLTDSGADRASKIVHSTNLNKTGAGL